jgi:hypothetical protein
MNDITLGGATIANAEINLTSTVQMPGTQTVSPNTMHVQVAGDVLGFSRAIVNVTVPTALSVTSTSTSMSIAGSFPVTFNGLNGTVITLNMNLAIAGTAQAGSGCTRHTPLQDLLGFESVDAWRSSAPLALDPANHTEGCFGLSVGGTGTRKIFSGPFATPLPGVTSELALDVRAPPGASFVGSFHMYLSCPSVGVINSHLVAGDIESNIVGQFGKVTFHVSSGNMALFNGNHPDCTLTLETIQTGGGTPITFDNLRFQVGDAD